MSTPDTPHFRQPFTRKSYVQQDTPEHIQSCWYTIAKCPVGARAERPEFGWDMPVMRPMPVNFDGLAAAFREFEPRVPDVTVTQAETAYGEIVQVQPTNPETS